jgi:membrane fusion protein (multidrug efflux system)
VSSEKLLPAPSVASAAVKAPETPRTRRACWSRRRIGLTAFLGFAGLGVAIAAVYWVGHRYTHSLSRDAFLDSDLINVSSYATGDIIEIYVQEQSVVTKGQLLAKIDPAVYEREVAVRHSQLAAARSGLHKAEADLAVAEQEVPRKVRIAERKLDIARVVETKANSQLALTTEEVEKGIRAAAASLAACKAALELAEADYRRYLDLYATGSVTQRKSQDATRAHAVARAEVEAATARLAQAEAMRHRIDIASDELRAAKHAVEEASAGLELARIGDLQVEVARRLVEERKELVESARSALQLAETNLGYTRVIAPYDGIITKNWRHLGDHVRPGDPIFNMYNPGLLYVTIHLEETLLEGVNVGNGATVEVDAFSQPFRGRVVWIGSATDANFSLIPRDVSAGEFTYVVQRVTVRLLLEPDERLPLLKPGLSAHVTIEHGPGDPVWAAQAWERMGAQSGVRPEKR